MRSPWGRGVRLPELQAPPVDGVGRPRRFGQKVVSRLVAAFNHLGHDLADVLAAPLRDQPGNVEPKVLTPLSSSKQVVVLAKVRFDLFGKLVRNEIHGCRRLTSSLLLWLRLRHYLISSSI